LFENRGLLHWQCGGVAGQGGGLAFSNLLAITLRDSVFEDNTAAKLGGGMWIAGLPKTETSVLNCTWVPCTLISWQHPLPQLCPPSLALTEGHWQMPALWAPTVASV